jgi:hypothetical protein
VDTRSVLRGLHGGPLTRQLKDEARWATTSASDLASGLTAAASTGA